MESGFIHPIQLLFDINFLAEDDFSFITFMRKMKTNNVFLVVSESGKIGNQTIEDTGRLYILGDIIIQGGFVCLC